MTLPVSISVTADGTVTIAGAGTVPAPAALLGFTNAVIDLVPTKAMIAPGRTGNYEFFQGLFYDPTVPDNTVFSDSAEGLILPSGYSICTQTRDSTQGKLPYLDGGKGFYVEAMIRSSDNNLLNWEAFWLMPKEHDIAMSDRYIQMEDPANPYKSNMERWCEIDIYEGWGRPNQLTTCVNWGGASGAPNPYGYGGRFYNNAVDTDPSYDFDKTVWNKYALSYDGNQTMVWYRNDVEIFRAVGDSTVPPLGGVPSNRDSNVPPVAAWQHFYIIFGNQSHDTADPPHPYTMTVGRVRAFIPPVSSGGTQFTRQVGYGDSLMYGTGVTNGQDALTWRHKLAVTLGLVDENDGVGGEASWNIADRFTAAKASYHPASDLFIFEGGYNNYSGVAGQVEWDIGRMVSDANSLSPTGTAKFIVMGVPSAEDPAMYIGGANRAKFDTINANLANTYGSRFFDVNAYLLTQGNGSSGDNTDISHGIVPRSLRADTSPHWNDAGHDKVYLGMKAKLQALGWS